jgi:pimeloyl-ACP methyl ester carboxylesterase
LQSATLPQLGEDLAEVLRQLAPAGPVVLAGHSMGGMTIMEYADTYPDEFADRVAGLLFVSTTAEGHTHTRYGMPAQVATLMRAGETLGAGLLARSGAWCPHRAVLPALRPAVRWLLFGEEFTDAALDVTMRAFGRASLRSIGGFRASIGAQQRLDTLAALGDVPSAVLVGDRDRLTPPACAESIADALPGTELTVLPGAGHMPMLERPFEVSQALSGVVGRATAARRPRRRTGPVSRSGWEQAA